jgi:hypothetical protein
LSKRGEEEVERQSLRGVFILLVLFVVIVSAGIWLVFTLDQHRKIDDCVTASRTDCVPQQIPAAR